MPARAVGLLRFVVDVEVDLADPWGHTDQTESNLQDRIRKAVADYPKVSMLRVKAVHADPPKEADDGTVD